MEVLPLAREGLSASEIGRITGRSYYSVVSCLHHLRQKERLPESSREFNKRLLQALSNPPDDPALRRQLLELVNFALFRRNLKFFTTPKKCFRLAGLGFSMGYSPKVSVEVIRVLNDADITLKEFTTKGKKARFWPYRIMLKADQDKAVSALRGAFTQQNPI